MLPSSGQTLGEQASSVDGGADHERGNDESEAESDVDGKPDWPAQECESWAMIDKDGDALAHSPIAQQTQALEAIVRSNVVACRLLDRVPELRLPSWYLGAGGVAQTVWNHLHGFAPTQGINDYDIVYFDPDDLTEATEKTTEATLGALARTGDGTIDVTNEARVHTWYEQRFGRPLDPYRSAEHSIATWPTTATSVGVRSDPSGFTGVRPVRSG